MSLSNPVIVVDYSEQWPTLFAQLKAVYQAALGDLAIGIEHVGSTSVPGLKVKPIIDIDIIVSDADKVRAVIPVLETLGYIHIGDLGITGREAFHRQSDHVPFDGAGSLWPMHNLYVCPAGSMGLQNHLKFRDYLRAHPEQAHAYGQLKEELAARFPDDINRYIDGKTAFILSILDRTGFEKETLQAIKAQNSI